MLISEHADGEIIARIADEPRAIARCAARRRAARRARCSARSRRVEEGHDLAITPDGPRGPAKSIAPGDALIVAQRTGAPMIAAAATAACAWRLKSWDGFLIPKPFARVDIAYSDAVHRRRPTRAKRRRTAIQIQRA